jgi:hypothetical protein
MHEVASAAGWYVLTGQGTQKDDVELGLYDPGKHVRSVAVVVVAVVVVVVVVAVESVVVVGRTQCVVFDASVSPLHCIHAVVPCSGAYVALAHGVQAVCECSLAYVPGGHRKQPVRPVSAMYSPGEQ